MRPKMADLARSPDRSCVGTAEEQIAAAIECSRRSAACMGMPSYVYADWAYYAADPRHHRLYQSATVAYRYLGERAAHVVAIVTPSGTVRRVEGV